MISKFGIRKIILEAWIETLAEEVKLSQKWHAKVLSEIGAWPFSQLGEGAFGTVYKCELDNGQRVAVKITNKEQEAINYSRIMKLKNEMPPSVSRHFPIIYDVIESKSINAYAIILELLDKLPHDIADDLFDTGTDVEMSDTTTRTFNYVYGDPENVIKAVRYAIAEYNRGRQEQYKIDKNKLNTLEKFALKQAANGKMPYILANFAYGLLGIRKQMLLTAPEEDMMKAFEDSFDTSVPYATEYKAKNKKTWVHNPTAKSLARALAFVRGRKIEWYDIKDANVGFRKSSGDIVILDLGLFDSMEN